MPRSQAHFPKARRSHLIAGFLVAGLLVAISLALAPSALARDPIPGRFDYYALSLSWSPTYCRSGLRMGDYFGLTRALFGKLRIPARYLSPQAVIMTTPEELVSDFVKTNRELTSNMLSVQCGNSRGAARLAELSVCFGKDGNLQDCGVNERRQCRAKSLVLPPARGGNP